MSLLILPTPLSPTSTQPTVQASPAITLPKLESPRDKGFSDYEPLTAGRAVMMELCPPKFVDKNNLLYLMDKHDASTPAELGYRMGIFLDGTPRQVGWQRFEGRIDFEAVGHAAQRLELAGYNWRQAIGADQVLMEAAKLPSKETGN